MAVSGSRPIVPTTGLGRVGVAIALLGALTLTAMLVAAALRLGPDERPGFGIAWLAITVGAAIIVVALYRGERALLALLALAPFALFVLLLLMELTGLME